MSPASPASSSNAIPIPARKNKAHGGSQGVAGSASSSSSSLRYGSFGSSIVSSTPSSAKGKRRESLMSVTFSKADYTVINVGEEESPRLVCTVLREHNAREHC